MWLKVKALSSNPSPAKRKKERKEIGRGPRARRMVLEKERG
jgi:hypothetical protein